MDLKTRIFYLKLKKLQEKSEEQRGIRSLLTDFKTEKEVRLESVIMGVLRCEKIERKGKQMVILN